MPKRIDDAAVYRAAMDVVLDHGYTGATMKLIAAASDVSELTLFRKYTSKAQLIAAAVAHSLTKLFDEDWWRPSGDVAADLRRFAHSFISSTERYGQLFAFVLAETARYPELSEMLQAPDQIIQRMAQFIAANQKQGVIRDGDPLLIVGALLGPIIINSMLRQGNPELAVPPIDLDWHLERFLSGHLRGDPTP